MNQTNNTIQFSQFAAVSKDSDEVLGKILYIETVYGRGYRFIDFLEERRR